MIIFSPYLKSKYLYRKKGTKCKYRNENVNVHKVLQREQWLNAVSNKQNKTKQKKRLYRLWISIEQRSC